MLVSAQNWYVFEVFHEFWHENALRVIALNRPLSGRDFASPATSGVNHSRGNLPTETLPQCLGRLDRNSIGGEQ